MNEPLRPSTLGEILDRTAQLYRSRFLLFLGISVVPTGVIVVLACVLGLYIAMWNMAPADATSSMMAGVLALGFFAGLLFIALPVYLATMALSSAAMSHAVSRVHLGQTMTIRDAYKSIWYRGWRYIWLYMLEGLIIGAAFIAVWIVLVLLIAGGAALAESSGAGSAAGGALFGLVVVLVIVALVSYVVWMALRLSLAFPACVVEQIGAWTAIKRSSRLSYGTKGRIFLLFLLGAVLSWLLSMGITLPLTIILSLLLSSGDPQHEQAAGLAIIFISYGATFAVQALVRPVYGIALVLFYYDQRIRMEGFDIEWMMQQAGMVDTLPPAAPLAGQQATPRLTAAPGNPFVPAPEPPQAVEFPQDKDST